MGRWMLGQRSRLILPPPPWGGVFRFSATIGPFLASGRLTEQPLTVLINGAPVLTTSLRHVMTIEFATPEGLISPDTQVEVMFVHPGALAPARFIPGEDARELALSVWSLTVLGPPRPEGLAVPPRQGPPVWQVRSLGNLGNRMIECMVARAVQARVPGSVLAGVELDEWGLSTEREAPGWADDVVLDARGLDVEAMAALLRRPGTRKIAHRGYGQRVPCFPPLETCREMFRPVTDNVTVYDERYLVINVRGGDIVDGHVPFYVLIPPNFYRDLIARARLIPVFMGQLDPNPYTALLRAAFPGALFVMSQGPMRDFETMRRARNLVVSISTFSWLAAWLSRATTIHLPVNGLFDPRHAPDVDLLPSDDPRYVFHLFPVNHAVPPSALERAFAAIDGTWREIDRDAVRRLREAPTRDAVAA
jgi:hypothetical protein